MPAYIPKPGYVWNPARNIPPNDPCPCLSGKKFKKCHRDKLPAVLAKPDHKAMVHEAVMRHREAKK